MSVFTGVVNELLQSESQQTDTDIGALLIPCDARANIQAFAIARDELETQIADLFPAEAVHRGPVCHPIDINNPSSSTIYAVYLSESHGAKSYNNRASELTSSNISHNVLLFELDEYGTFTTNTEVLRGTIAELCDDARNEGLWSTIWRSVKTTVSQTSLGAWAEGMNSTS